ncbi:MAG: (Fe-S)-binding protein [Candidatus Hydrogenedentota bacterium]
MDDEKLLEVVNQCVRCGACKGGCPVSAVLLNELASSRGKLVLIEKVLKGEIPFNEEVLKSIFECTLCMNCASNCPRSIEIENAYIEMRKRIIENYGKDFIEKIAYKLISERDISKLLFKSYQLFEKLLSKRLEDDRGIKLRFPLPLIKNRILPSIPDYTLNELWEKEIQASRGFKKEKDVGFFTGCMVEYLKPEFGIRLFRILEKAGERLGYTSKQSCCGAPHYLSGLTRESDRLKNKNIEAFQDFSCVITLCSTCAWYLKKYLNKEIYDFMEYLKILIDRGIEIKPVISGRVSYHFPCHQVRGQNLKSMVYYVLKSIFKENFIKIDNDDSCCGGGGMFTYTYPDTAFSITEARLDNYEKSEYILTNCIECIIVLNEAVIKNGRNIKIMHILEAIE